MANFFDQFDPNGIKLYSPNPDAPTSYGAPDTGGLVAPRGNYFDRFDKPKVPDRSMGERAERIATLVPQGVNNGLYNAVMALPNLSGYVAQKLGLVSPGTPLPSEIIHNAGNEARDNAGVTYNPNVTPETPAEKIALGTGEAIGGVAATAIPGGIVARTAAPAVAGFRTAIPTYGQTVAKELATRPGLQATAGVAGNAATALTGNPYIGMATSLAVPTVAHAGTRIPFSAPAETSSEAERRALLATAKENGILPSFGTIVDSGPARMFESVLSKLPFVGNTITKMNESNRTAFNKAAINKIPEVAGEGIDAAIPGNMDLIGSRIGKKFNALENDTTVKIDPQVGADIAAAKAGFSKQLESQMPQDISKKLNELEGAANVNNQPGVTNVTLDGTTYKNIRSKLSKQLTSTTGTDRDAVGAMIDALDGAVERSLPKDMVKDWQDARLSWRRYLMLRGATDARHNASTDVGNIPPGSMAARAGNDKEMQRLASVGTSFVGDKMPDSGTANRLLTQNAIGLGLGGGAGFAFPTSTAIGLGAGYGANLALNNPLTRKFLINRLQNSREDVLRRGLVGLLAAQQISGNSK